MIRIRKPQSRFAVASIILAPVALALSVGTAQAASHNLATFIQEQDLDHDGKVTKEEFQQGRDAEFRRIDSNHDGMLSHDEYVGDFAQRLKQRLPTLPEDERAEERTRQMRQADVRFKVLDSDGSGGISPAEFAASGWHMFLDHDTNHDGVVSPADSAEPVGE